MPHYRFCSHFKCLLTKAFICMIILAARSAPSQEVHADPAIHERMQKYVDEGQASGIVTLVADREHVLHLDVVGLADVAAKKPMTADTLFAIASMTKPITATAVVILEEQGKLKLDDPVSKYLPAFNEMKLKSGERTKNVMTIRHLLTHTSGLGGEQKNEGTLAETAEALAKRPLDFEPGTSWQYSPSLNVAGRIVEVASGETFDQFLAKHIFEPLDMHETSFLPSADKQAHIAKLYQPGKTSGTLEVTTHWINDLSPNRQPNPSGGLFSTASDLSHYYQMILRGGERNGVRIVSQDTVRDMARVQTGDLTTGFTPGNGWGLGFCVIQKPQGVTEMLSSGSFGHGGAFGTQGWMDPEKGLAFVLLIQRTNFGNSDASDMRGDFQRLAVKAFGK